MICGRIEGMISWAWEVQVVSMWEVVRERDVVSVRVGRQLKIWTSSSMGSDESDAADIAIESCW